MTHSADTRTTMEKRGCPIGLKHKLHGPNTTSTVSATTRAALRRCHLRSHRSHLSRSYPWAAHPPGKEATYAMRGVTRIEELEETTSDDEFLLRVVIPPIEEREDLEATTNSEEEVLPRVVIPPEEREELEAPTNSEEEVLPTSVVIPPEELEERGRRIPGKKSSHAPVW